MALSMPGLRKIRDSPRKTNPNPAAPPGLSAPLDPPGRAGGSWDSTAATASPTARATARNRPQAKPTAQA